MGDSLRSSRHQAPTFAQMTASRRSGKKESRERSIPAFGTRFRQRTLSTRIDVRERQAARGRRSGSLTLRGAQYARSTCWRAWRRRGRDQIAIDRSLRRRSTSVETGLALKFTDRPRSLQPGMAPTTLLRCTCAGPSRPTLVAAVSLSVARPASDRRKLATASARPSFSPAAEPVKLSPPSLP